jgi:hypothetical protein
MKVKKLNEHAQLPHKAHPGDLGYDLFSIGHTTIYPGEVALVNTGIANAKALAATPLTFGQPFIAINTISAALSIASSVAAGLKAIQQIKSSDSGSSATATSVASPRGGASVTPPTVAAADAPQIRTEGGQNPSQQIADTIGAASGKPIKTYVLAQDVSSKQAFDRRTNNAASF